MASDPEDELLSSVSNMPSPIIAQKAPYPVEVEANKDYYWCACGHSSKQPFCDGSHKDTGMAPLCDGTHATL